MSLNRIEGLDWLRFLMATGIMLYHYAGWLWSSPDSSTILGRLSICGVWIFFALSGLSMALAYANRIKSIRASLGFYAKRLLRILPLWLILMVTLLIVNDDWQTYSLGQILLNLTLTFSFVDPDKSLFFTGWTLGNEMVYYAWTPLILWLYDKKKSYGNVFFFAVVALGVVFVNLFLTDSMPAEWQGGIYANPYNSFLFFVAGIAMYYNFRRMEIGPDKGKMLIVLLLALLCVIPVRGDIINLVTGYNKAVFAILSLLAVLIFWKIDLKRLGVSQKIAKKLSTATYSVYLLHPFVFVLLMSVSGEIWHFLPAVSMAVSAAATIMISLLSYKVIELPFIKIGKKIAL